MALVEGREVNIYQLEHDPEADQVTRRLLSRQIHSCSDPFLEKQGRALFCVNFKHKAVLLVEDFGLLAENNPPAVP
jgi:hypothetical protein